MSNNYCACSGDNNPEYIIELNQQGAPGQQGEKGDQGYSPIVDFIANDNEIRFTSTNETNITSTPNLYDYVAKKDLSNTTINDYLADYVTLDTKQTITGAKTFSQTLTIKELTSYQSNTHISNQLGGGILTIEGDTIFIGSTPLEYYQGKWYYKSPNANNELATLGNIPLVSNATITFKQGDTTAGSFTLNQGGDATIELDSGITNPLTISKTDNNLTYSLVIGINDNNQFVFNQITSGVGFTIEEKLLPRFINGTGTIVTSHEPTTGSYNVYSIDVNVDNETLKVNDNGQLYAVNTGGDSSTSDTYGVQGYYSTHYGILDCPNGLIDYNATGKSITVNPGIVLQCAGTTNKTTIASSITKTLDSTQNIVLFYVNGELLECGKVDYQEEEPADNGVDNYQAWFKPSEQKWYFKSIDDGNVFRDAVATPLANIHIVDGNITRVDYIGYRILDDDIIAQLTDVESLENTIETLQQTINNQASLIESLTTRITALETTIDGGNS